VSRRGRRPPGASPLPWDRVYPTLDLHGHTAEEATRRADLWLREEQRGGIRTVRIVTGKGNRSRGLPVLPGEIEALLQSLQGSVVASWARQPGGGAYEVKLLRPRAPQGGEAARPRPGTAMVLFDDPDLYRRAEEALWELGVQPTPELVRAEMRRQRERSTGRKP
jgi:hypothetical protein